MKEVDFLKAVRSKVDARVRDALSAIDNAHLEVLTSGRFLRTRIAYSLAENDSASQYLDLMDRCSALELLHASTLVHDDIVDRASTRHGYPALSRAIGVEQSLFAGNLLAAAALQAAKVSNNPRTVDAVIRATSAVNRGQLLELQAKGRIGKTIEDYLDVMSGKTSAMFQLAVEISVNVEDQAFDHVCKAVRFASIAFQIVDDIEDVEEWLTRPNAGAHDPYLDLDNGLYTAPTIYATQHHAWDVDIRTLDPSQISPDDWSFGLDMARDLLHENLEFSLQEIVHLEDAKRFPGFVLFMRSIIDALATESTEQVVQVPTS